jgi:thiol-disulfide isomerase/thioredoxin
MLLVIVTSFGIIALAYYKSIIISIRPVLVWNGISLLGFGIGFGINKIPIENELKISFIAGLVLFFFESSSRSYGEGWFAIITFLASCMGAIYLVSLVNHKKLLNSFLFLSPMFILNLAFSSEFFGLSLVFPTLIISSVIALVILNLNWKDFTVKTKFCYLAIFILTGILAWPVQENYASWRYSSLNSPLLHSVNYSFRDINGNTLTPLINSGKTVVCLFWSTQCPRCKLEYPAFSELAEKYHNIKGVEFYGVFISFRPDDTLYFNKITQQKFDFKWVKAEGGRNIYDQLKMSGVPHLTIFNKKNEVVYNGWVRNRPWIWINRPEHIINRSL